VSRPGVKPFAADAGMSRATRRAVKAAHESGLTALAAGAAGGLAAARGLARALETDRYWRAWTRERLDVYGWQLDDDACEAVRGKLRTQIGESLDPAARWEFRRESAGLRALHAHLDGTDATPIAPSEALEHGVPPQLREVFRRAAQEPDARTATYYSSLGPALARLEFDDPEGCLTALACAHCGNCSPLVSGTGATISLCSLACPRLAARNPGFWPEPGRPGLEETARAMARQACVAAGTKALERLDFARTIELWRFAQALADTDETVLRLRNDLLARVLAFVEILRSGDKVGDSEHFTPAIAFLQKIRAQLLDDVRLWDALAACFVDRAIASANGGDLTAALADSRAAYQLAETRAYVWKTHLALLRVNTTRTRALGRADEASRLLADLRCAADAALAADPHDEDAIAARQFERQAAFGAAPANVEDGWARERALLWKRESMQSRPSAPPPAADPGRSAEAERIAELEGTLARQPDSPIVRRQLIQAYELYADRLLADGFHETALRTVERGLALAPAHDGLRATQAELLWRMTPVGLVRRYGGQNWWHRWIESLPRSWIRLIEHLRSSWLRLRESFARRRLRPSSAVMAAAKLLENGGAWAPLTGTPYSYEQERTARSGALVPIRAHLTESLAILETALPHRPETLLRLAAAAMHVPYTRVQRHGAGWWLTAKIPVHALAEPLLTRVVDGLVQLAALESIDAAPRVTATDAVADIARAAADKGLAAAPRRAGDDFVFRAPSGAFWSVSRWGDEFVFEERRELADQSPTALLACVAEINQRLSSLRAGIGARGELAVRSGPVSAEDAFSAFTTELAGIR
jgi:hypothetical protein